MEFNDLLEQEKLNSEKVLVFRHRPKEKELRKVMPWLVRNQVLVDVGCNDSCGLRACYRIGQCDFRLRV